MDRLKVLIASEMPEERALVRRALDQRRDVGRLLEAEDGVTAHLAARAEPFDLAVVSSSLGKIDGLTLVRTLVRAPASRGVRTLLLLGRDAAARMREVITARPSALIVRPFDEFLFLARFDQALAADAPAPFAARVAAGGDLSLK